jgi:hypothetical protein
MLVKKKREIISPKFNKTQKYLGIPLMILFLIFSIILILQISKGVNESFKDKTISCGDGTMDGNCSLNKPYYCYEGVLIEKASSCGCPKNFTQNKDSCTTKYETYPKKILLKYVLRGEEKEIPFVIYRGVENYVSNLTRYLVYENGEKPSIQDFKLKIINEPIQREYLLPLVIEIQNSADSKEDQLRIAVSLVQQIPFGFSEKLTLFGGRYINYSRYPYDVLWDSEGICGEKSDLLAFLLKELGYDIVLFHHYDENHESVGVKCPEEYSLDNTGYCFIETTGASIMTDHDIEYIGGIKLKSTPEVIPISNGYALKDDLYEYKDAKTLIKINQIVQDKGRLNLYRQDQLERLEKKYDLEKEYNAA